MRKPRIIVPKPKAFVEIQELLPAVNLDGWNWLTVNAPDYAICVENAVDAGYTPEQIFQYILRVTSRELLAHRCQAGARFLVSNQKE